MSYIKFIGTNQVELVNSLNENKISPEETGENFIEFSFNSLSKNDQDYYHFIITGENVQVSGDISSSKKQEFINLFKDCTQITDASGLTISWAGYEACCANMFLNCTNLTTPPRLTSINLAPWCYSGMFAGCTSLTSAPDLPASTLAPYCYYAMFYNCRSLSTAPYLPAETLTDWCYNSMFYNCTSLNSISATFTEWKGNATSSWVTNVSKAGFFKNDNVEKIYSNSNIPIDWRDYLTFYCDQRYSLNVADNKVISHPQNLPKVYNARTFKNGQWSDWQYYQANQTIILNNGGYIQLSGSNEHLSGNCHITSNYALEPVVNNQIKVFGNVNSLINFQDVAKSEYRNLFSGCINLVDASRLVLPSMDLANWCYQNMFASCKHLSAAPALPASTLTPFCYYAMFYGCTSLKTFPQLPATTATNRCYSYMFAGCSGLTGAVTLPATGYLKTGCYQTMFSGCTNITLAHISGLTLYDTTTDCFRNMFKGCSKLKYVNVNFTSWGRYIMAADDSRWMFTDNWLSGVATNGTFSCPTGLDTTTKDSSHVPVGWTVINKEGE